MTRKQYLEMLNPPEIDARERRTLIRLRFALLAWCVLVATVVFPPAGLLAFMLPRWMRAYACRLDGKCRSRFAPFAEAGLQVYRAPSTRGWSF